MHFNALLRYEQEETKREHFDVPARTASTAVIILTANIQVIGLYQGVMAVTSSNRDVSTV